MLQSIEENATTLHWLSPSFNSFTCTAVVSNLLPESHKWAWPRAWPIYFLQHSSPSYSFRMTQLLPPPSTYGFVAIALLGGCFLVCNGTQFPGTKIAFPDFALTTGAINRSWSMHIFYRFLCTWALQFWDGGVLNYRPWNWYTWVCEGKSMGNYTATRFTLPPELRKPNSLRVFKTLSKPTNVMSGTTGCVKVFIPI